MGLFTGTWTLKATGPDESVPLRSSRLHFVGLNIARDLSGLWRRPEEGASRQSAASAVELSSFRHVKGGFNIHDLKVSHSATTVTTRRL